MNDSLISIVIPVYNAQETIQNTLCSVLNQNYNHLEVILVNDGSSDRSKEIMESMMQMDSRITLINQKNMGVSQARNKGMQEAKGKYLMFVDSDDILKENMLKGMVEGMPDTCSMLFGGYSMIQAASQDRKALQTFVPIKDEFIDKTKIKGIYDIYFLNKIFLSIWGKLYRMDVIRKHTIQFKKDLKIGEDMLFIQDILTLGYPIYAYSKIVYEYMIGTSNSLTKESSISRITNAEFLLKESFAFGSILNLEKDKLEIFPNYFLRTCFVTIEHSSKNEKRELIKAILQNEELHKILNDYELHYIEDKIYKYVLQSHSYILIQFFVVLRKLLKRKVKQ